MVIHTLIAPCMSYGMELWDVSRPCTVIDQVLVQAVETGAGVRGSSVCPAFVWSRSIKRGVMLSDMHGNPP